MTELVPLSRYMGSYDQEIAAESIRELVCDPEVRGQLQAHNFLGMIRQFAPSNSEAVAQFRKSRISTARSENAAYTILGDKQHIVGFARVSAKFALKKQRLSYFALPPRLAIGPLATSIPIDGPEVTVWTNEGGDGEHRKNAYKQLLEPLGLADSVYASFKQRQTSKPYRAPLIKPSNVWTIEPLESATFFHAAIRTAGLVETGRGIYDDGQSVRLFPPEMPPISILYTRFGPEGLDTAA
jgi:hypothetical protein